MNKKIEELLEDAVVSELDKVFDDEPKKDEPPPSLKVDKHERSPVLNSIPMKDLKRILDERELSASKIEKQLEIKPPGILNRCIRGEIYMDDDIAKLVADYLEVTMHDIRQKGLAPIPKGKVDHSMGLTVEKKANGEVFDVVEEGGDFIPDKNMLKCRKVKDKSGIFYDGYTLSFEEQIIILTGVKYHERFRDYICFALPEAVLEGEVWTDPQLFNIEGELAVVMKNLGTGHEVEVGKPVAIFRKMLVADEREDIL